MKRLEDMSFDELVDHSASRILLGLIYGGGKEFKSQVYLWMSKVIEYSVKKKEEKNDQ